MALGLKHKGSKAVANSFHEIAVRRAGSWYKYRRYHLDRKANTSKLTGEGTDGNDRWEFTDEPVVSRHESTGITGTKGLLTDQSIFYLEKGTSPKRGDVIIRVELPDAVSLNISPIEVLQAKHLQAYRITEIDTKRASHGQISHYACIVDPEFGNY